MENTKQTSDRNRTVIRTGIIGIVTNVLLAAFKAAVGILSSSVSVILDAVNNISDETYRNIYTPYPTPGREYKFTIIQGF